MFSIGFLTLDILVTIILFGAFFFLSVSKGEQFLARIIIINYLAILLYTFLPYITVSGVVPQLLTYVGICIGLYILTGKHITAKRSYAKGRRFFDAAFLAAAALVTLLTIYYHVLPLEYLYSFTPPFAYLFTTTLPLGMLLIIPLVLMAIANRGHHG